MNRKRNICYIKPEDPHFLKVMKKQAGYDDKNHKFDELDSDFVEDAESEQPQVVVLKQGDLTADEAKVETERLKKEESEAKADLNQKVIFKPKLRKKDLTGHNKVSKKSRHKEVKKKNQLLSFADDEDIDK